MNAMYQTIRGPAESVGFFVEKTEQGALFRIPMEKLSESMMKCRPERGEEVTFRFETVPIKRTKS